MRARSMKPSRESSAVSCMRARESQGGSQRVLTQLTRLTRLTLPEPVHPDWRVGRSHTGKSEVFPGVVCGYRMEKTVVGANCKRWRDRPQRASNLRRKPALSRRALTTRLRGERRASGKVSPCSAQLAAVVRLTRMRRAPDAKHLPQNINQTIKSTTYILGAPFSLDIECWFQSAVWF